MGNTYRLSTPPEERTRLPASRHALLLYTTPAASRTRRYTAVAAKGVTPAPQTVHKKGVVADIKKKKRFMQLKKMVRRRRCQIKKPPCNPRGIWVFFSAKARHEHHRTYVSPSEQQSQTRTLKLFAHAASSTHLVVSPPAKLLLLLLLLLRMCLLNDTLTKPTSIK